MYLHLHTPQIEYYFQTPLVKICWIPARHFMIHTRRKMAIIFLLVLLNRSFSKSLSKVRNFLVLGFRFAVRLIYCIVTKKCYSNFCYRRIQIYSTYYHIYANGVLSLQNHTNQAIKNKWTICLLIVLVGCNWLLNKSWTEQLDERI